MKKSILFPMFLLLVLISFSSCEQSIYETKRIFIENESEVLISGVTLTYYDQEVLINRDLQLTTIIGSHEKKEYALPYINNGGRSSQCAIRVQAYSVDGEIQTIEASKYLYFTFNTSLHGDITFTFDEATEPDEYTLLGEGSGIQIIPDLT